MSSPAPLPSSLPPSRPPVLLACALLTAVFAVLLVLVAVEWGPLVALDDDIANGLHRWAIDDPATTRVMRVLSDWVWDPWAMRAVIAVVFFWLLVHGERTLAVAIAVTSALGALVQQVLKAAVGKERPQWPDPVDSAQYAAFPSGHAMTAAVTFSLLLWLLARFTASRAARAALLVVAVVSVLGVGFTRLYLGVHWFSDVLGGWLLGVAVVLGAVRWYAYLQARRGCSPA
ncbi:phosphatase PAP2 family protein [Streptomyces sp. NBC_00237]|uniref:phosphatase PAP2 family protein n=1 Tax=Streptomyces sp. NBC_00237 TaxID=2975687 RepID=UPI002252F443|nr:phosphatase PAP2 family protein [Streptomyces sp. NBC_00237]MCX5207065.1 phosphatase PAP2 family protein [Streptomyces sp. NBC_00237]